MPNVLLFISRTCSRIRKSCRISCWWTCQIRNLSCQRSWRSKQENHQQKIWSWCCQYICRTTIGKEGRRTQSSLTKVRPSSSSSIRVAQWGTFERLIPLKLIPLDLKMIDALILSIIVPIYYKVINVGVLP